MHSVILNKKRSVPYISINEQYMVVSIATFLTKLRHFLVNHTPAGLAEDHGAFSLFKKKDDVVSIFVYAFFTSFVSIGCGDNRFPSVRRRHANSRRHSFST